jgi:hypothetical protein
MPAPLPARVTDWRASAFASSTSWRSSSVMSLLTSANSSPMEACDRSDELSCDRFSTSASEGVLSVARP